MDYLVLVLLLLGTLRANAQCTDAFLSRAEIGQALSSQVHLVQVEDTHLLFPSVNFSCTTTVTGWILAGENTTSAGTLYPQIQIFRLDSLGQYRLQNTTEQSTRPTSLGDSLYQYTLDPPFTVMAGDVVSIRTPPIGSDDDLLESAGILPLVLNTSRTLTQNLQRQYDPLQMFFNMLDLSGTMYYPLVTPVLLSVSSSITSVTSTSTVSTVSSSTPSRVGTTYSPSSTESSQTSSTTSNVDLSLSTTTTTTTIATTTSAVNMITTLSSSTTVSFSTPISVVSTSSSGIVARVTTASRTNPSSSLSSSTSSSVVVGIGSGNNNSPPAAVIAGSVIAVILVIVIVALVIVLVALFALGKKKASKDEVASPPNGYVEAGSPFDNPNYTPVSNNVQLVSVQSTASTMTGDRFVSHYEVPGYSDPIGSPLPYYETKPGSAGDGKTIITNGIYGDNGFDDSHYELGPHTNSQTVLIGNGHHYEVEPMSSLPRMNGHGLYSPTSPVNHYEMEFNNGIYEMTGDPSGYERPVSSKNNTMIRHYDDPQLAINQYHEITPPATHDYSVLDGNIIVPSEEERSMMRKHSAVFDERSYAQLGVIQKQKYENFGVFEKSDFYWKPSTQASVLYEQLSKKKYREIPRNQLHITKHLGSGQFGTVNEGVWSTAQGQLQVALKLVSSTASEAEKVKLLQEGAIMGQFQHKNVVGLHGVVTVGEPVMVVIELMPKGDLRNHLKYIRQDIAESTASPDVPKQLLQFCKEVAEGMSYLSKKSFVHRDLAARNIFLTQDLVCKVGDFGMSRDLEDENYYISHGGKIPVKWTAPEALQYKKYSTLSDVWSYAALLYEIWSLAHKPFEGFSNPQTIDLVQSGYRLPPPPGCPRMMYQLMIHCWHPDSGRRPKFSDIVDQLSEQPKRLLSWRDIDKSVHVQASVLGAPLEAGQDLYPELQQTFIRSTIKIK